MKDINIWTLGDLHWGQYPLEPKWYREMVKYFDEFLIPLLKTESKPGDVLVQLGDVFHDRGVIDIKVMNTVDRVFEEIAKILPVHMLVGNHDLYNISDNTINSSKILRNHKNIFLYEKTTDIDLGGFKCVMMPWVNKREDQINLLKEHSPADYLFCHSDLNGCKMHLNSVAHKNFSKIDVDEFTEYGQVISGHIHISQENKNFLFTGSAYQLDRNDIGNDKGIYIFNKDGKRFIQNTISPVFKKISILNEEDINKLEMVDTSKDYIDLSISNSMLINNRKMRRKLEKILETSSFTSIDYIDDLSREEVDIDKSIEDLDIVKIDEHVDLTKFEGFQNIILEYINNKDHNSETIKKGVLQEFSEIVDIYEEKFKDLKNGK